MAQAFHQNYATTGPQQVRNPELFQKFENDRKILHIKSVPGKESISTIGSNINSQTSPIVYSSSFIN